MRYSYRMDTKPRGPECPICGEVMCPTVMTCAHCIVEIRGLYRQSSVSRLSVEDQEFLGRYLLSEFSIKALSEQSGLGYLAIRNRLDRVIEAYRSLDDGDRAQRAILERLERGEITAEEAALAIERL